MDFYRGVQTKIQAKEDQQAISSQYMMKLKDLIFTTWFVKSNWLTIQNPVLFQHQGGMTYHLRLT